MLQLKPKKVAHRFQRTVGNTHFIIAVFTLRGGGLTGVARGARFTWTPPALALRTAAGRLGNTNSDLVGAFQALRGISAGTDVQETAPRASVCARAHVSDACPERRLIKPTICGGVLPTQPTPVGLSSKSKGHWHK